MVDQKGKALVIFLVIVAALGVLYAVPTTRYGILGNFVKKDVRIVITDSVTKKPVSQAVVKINGQSETTSEKGEATIKNVPVGEYTLETSKKCYKDTKKAYEVPVFGDTKKIDEQLVATGRQVEVKVTNTITKAALAKVSIVVGDTSAITDSKGVATIVLPAEKKTMDGVVSLDGYNDKKVSVTVTDQTNKNMFALTPSGQVYYLSNLSGTQDIVKANLDGSGTKTVVSGTGNENPSNATLLSSRDWKYVVLSAHRTDDADEQLYILNTTTEVLTLFDKGDDVYFNLVGWSGHKLIYTVYRHNKQDWEKDRQSIKSYDADAGKLSVIETTAATGSNVFDVKYEQLTNVSLIGDTLVYGKGWHGGAWYGVSDPIKNKSAILSVKVDGTQKTTPKRVCCECTSRNGCEGQKLANGRGYGYYRRCDANLLCL